jgi:hypothetical protein
MGEAGPAVSVEFGEVNEEGGGHSGERIAGEGVRLGW